MRRLSIRHQNFQMVDFLHSLSVAKLAILQNVDGTKNSSEDDL
jgi:hypothetical protein